MRPAATSRSTTTGAAASATTPCGGGAGRRRHQQRELRHAAGRPAAAHADVHLDQPEPGPRRRSRRRHRVPRVRPRHLQSPHRRTGQRQLSDQSSAARRRLVGLVGARAHGAKSAITAPTRAAWARTRSASRPRPRHPHAALQHDPAVNTWTYASINGMAVPHGVGSVWAQAAWEVYWKLVDRGASTRTSSTPTATPATSA